MFKVRIWTKLLSPIAVARYLTVGVRLVVRCAPLPEPVYLDSEMWEKIILNLLSNAFKFTFAGEIEVNCRADRSHVEVSVRDTGTGIPEHELPRIFERFHRVENAKGRTHEGTGIGLALVKELVKLQGGGIDVSSICGKGTVFTSIPFGTAHLPPDRVSAARTQASTATQAEAYIEEALHWLPEPAPTEAGGEATSESPSHGEHRPRVLVADDNADMRAYLRSILSARYDVDIAADGVAAFETMQANRPTLAILDVMMPRMDGFAVLRALREHSSLKDLPVILLSARAGEEAETEGLAAGADDYIVKPFSARELLARVQANINLATLRNEAAATLRASEERLKRVLETDAVGVLFWDRERCLADANDVFLRMTGYTREDVRSGKLHWRTLTAPEHISASEAQLETFAKTGRVGPYEKEYFRKDGSRAWMLFAGRDLGDGSLVEFAIDIADRKRAEAALRENEQRLHLLLREVNHRAKNMLSLVQAVARQTAAASPQDFLARFAERIQAPATSQDLLVNAEWKGVDLVELVRLQLAHFQDLIGARIELRGPPLLISPSAAQTLGMTLHELATNAGKYGALSVAEGRIAIAWGIERRDGDGEVFTMSWRERGGPPVAAPSRKGFGSRVIGRLAESSLNAKVDLEFAERGLSWRLQCPAAGVVEGKLPAPTAETRYERDASNGSRPKVLVVEDEALVAMEIAHVLKDADFEVLGPARAVTPALSLLEECGCDAAVLDINLGGETSEAVARTLLANGTRFITLSGYSRTQHPPIFDDVPALAKPLRPALLIEEIKRCLAAKENLPTA